MTLLQEMRAQREEILAAAKRHGIASVRVFGSVARGEERPDSDIDLLIDMQRPVEDGLGFVRFVGELEQMFARRISISFENGLFPAMKQSIESELQEI
jgi:hypothetical protein